MKNGGHFVISIKASCIDSTAAPEAVFAREVKKLQGTYSILLFIKCTILCFQCKHDIASVVFFILYNHTYSPQLCFPLFLSAEQLKPQEQLTLEPYERDHAVVVGIYRAPKKA